MLITDKTYCGKKDADQPGGYSRLKVYSSKVANALQLGRHGATLAQLNAKGFMVYALTEYDLAIEKLSAVLSDDGSLISYAKIDLTDAEIAVNTERVKRSAIAAARDSASTVLLELVAPYSEEERGTWPTQQAEARAWRLDDTAPCVMLRRIASVRGITMQEMTDKVMENVELFEHAAGEILGAQQKTISDIEE